MAKESELNAISNFYENGELEDTFNHNKKIEYTNEQCGSNIVDASSSPKAVNFEGIVSKMLILRNNGDGVITYKLSGATAQTGTLETGGILMIHNGNVSSLEISTLSTAPITYEYIIQG